MPRRAALPLLGAAAGILVLILTWFAAFHLGVVERADRSILGGFGGLRHRPRVGSIANFVAGLCDPKPYVYFCVVPVLVALMRRRIWVAMAIGAILLGSNVSTQLLKPLLAQPRGPSFLNGPDPASWPSGHATAAMALALCLVLAVPARARPFAAALGAAFAVAVCYSFLTLGWHFPTDVLGGFVIAAVWTLLGVAAVFTADAHRRGVTLEPSQRTSIREALGPPAVALAAAVLLAVVVLLARPHEFVTYASLHRSFVVGAAAIGALGFGLATGLTLALRR